MTDHPDTAKVFERLARGEQQPSDLGWALAALDRARDEIAGLEQDLEDRSESLKLALAVNARLDLRVRSLERDKEDLLMALAASGARNGSIRRDVARDLREVASSSGVSPGSLLYDLAETVERADEAFS